jgi:DNA-binding transcriptional LysR family regulator
LLFHDTRVVVMNSRLAKRLGNQLSLKAFTMLDHGLVSVEGRGEGLVDTALRVHGLKRRVMLHVPSFTLVPEICAARDLLFTLPYRITRTFPRSPKLVALPPPIAIDPPSFYIYWHARNPMHAWFRKLVYECAANLDEDQARRNQPDTISG